MLNSRPFTQSPLSLLLDRSQYRLPVLIVNIGIVNVGILKDL